MIGDETQESKELRDEVARSFADRVLSAYLALPDNIGQVRDRKDISLWMDAARLAYLETGCTSCGGSPAGNEFYEGDVIPEVGNIECSLCHTSFERMEQDMDQAYSCASNVYGAEIRCGYGSIYDMDTWKIKGDQGSVPNGLICDPCIERLRDDGKIARTGGLSWP